MLRIFEDGQEILLPETDEEREAEIFRRIDEVKEKKLTALDLGGLGLTEISDAVVERVSEVSWITELYLGPHRVAREKPHYPHKYINEKICNAVREIPATLFSALPHLTHLDLTNNSIGDDGAKAIAASLTQITKLYLKCNSVGAEGAKAIAASLTQLTNLDLDNNSIGIGIGDGGAKAIAASLIQLTNLDLGSNNIGDNGAKAIAASLTQLTNLDLGSNNIGDDGAKAIATLTQLTRLNLHNNSIGDDGVRAMAVSLTQLTILFLGQNYIGDEGAKAIASLKQLTNLYLHDNLIGDTGTKAIANSLTNLNLLTLSRNTIGDLGAKVLATSLTQLTNLHLEGNKIKLLTKEELETRDAQALIAAIKRKSNATNLEPLNEAKLIVVGNEAVGKTSVIQYLEKNLPRDPDEKKTPGIAQRDQITTQSWRPDGSEITLNIWDFGGQDIYHNIHRYFLTERSLYLLLLEDRRENEGDALRQLHHWMRTIRDRAGNAPVLVVINKSEEGKEKLRLDEDGLKREYINIVGYLRTSCDDDDWSRTTIQALRESILQVIQTDERMTHVTDLVTPAFLRVKQDIIAEAKATKILTQSRFAEICAQGRDNELSDDLAITNEAEQRGMLSTLDHLGVIVAKGYDRKVPTAVGHVHLLDPTWLTDAIYTILTKTKENMKSNGQFEAGCLDDWLDSEIYTRVHHEYVLAMMQEDGIGLCFRLPDEEGETYLVPESLPMNSPDIPISEDALRFRYKYDLLPEGLIPRFIVEANQHMPKDALRWRTGITLRIFDSFVVVLADLEGKQVDIAVMCQDEKAKGDKRQRDLTTALAVVRGLFGKVHARHNEIDPVEWVPFPDNPENEIKYATLLDQEKKFGSDHQITEESSGIYTVGELLNGIRGKISRVFDAEGTAKPAIKSDNTAIKEPLRREYVAIGLGAIAFIITFLVYIPTFGLDWYVVPISLVAGVIGFVAWMMINPKFAFIGVAAAFASYMIGGNFLWQFIFNTARLIIPKLPAITLPIGPTSWQMVAAFAVAVAGAVAMFRDKSK